MEWVILSAAGRLARVDVAESPWQARAAHSPRVDHDVIASAALAVDGYVAAVSGSGMAYRVGTEQLPSLVPGGPWSLWDATTTDSVITLPENEHIVGLYSLDIDAAPLALGTTGGVVKRVVPEYKGWEDWQVMAVKDDDSIVGVTQAADAGELVFITSEAQLLRLSAREVRPQGRTAGGMAGIKLPEGSEVIFFGSVSKEDREQAVVATMAVGPGSPACIKVTGWPDYPAKGRNTGGVRTHRFLKGQDHLALAWVGLPPVRACDASGTPRNLPAATDRRDGTGAKVYGPFSAFG